ncbi:hypothetical protein SFUMM280S_08603 [Streptomyces fumanus]
MGANIRPSRAAIATRVPIGKDPSMVSTPPSPYTTAVAREAISITVISSISAYTEVTTPMSRTRAARRANRRFSCSGRPKSLVSSAPATLNRSIMSELISASCCIDSRVSRCSRRPTSLPGSMNSGSITSAAKVSAQDR